jgi:four helix bundle protein
VAFAETHRDLLVFKAAYSLALEVRPLTHEMPKSEQYGGIADQMRRASTGICANLAEGFAKNKSKLEFRRFVGMALGSASEMDVWLMFSADFGYLSAPVSEELRQRYAEVSKMLRGLEQKLSS